MNRIYQLILIINMMACFNIYATTPIVQEGLYIHDSDKTHLSLFKEHPELVIDLVDSDGYELWGPKGLSIWLDTIDIFYTDVTLKRDSSNTGYPSPKEIEKSLENLAKKNPHIFQLIKVGESVKGRPLLVMKVSDNPTTDEFEPEVKYIANMHGDEIVGRELMMKLLSDFARLYGKDQSITKLINTTEIFIMPSMNPDGAKNRRRGNANWKDLNRSFPDFTDKNQKGSRPKETVAVMNFQEKRHFSLSANFHGGAVCVNYPWDSAKARPPLHNLIREISVNYAENVEEMRNSTRFPGGITNGYDWYPIYGGMQDWSYHWYDDLQITIELSRSKWPSYETINQYYNDNYESLISFLYRVHQGAGFKINGSQTGTVKVTKLPDELIGNFSFFDGEFYKVLDVGEYEFEVKTSKGKEYKLSTVVRAPVI